MPVRDVWRWRERFPETFALEENAQGSADMAIARAHGLRGHRGPPGRNVLRDLHQRRRVH